jgi:hypothetical protein
MWSKLSTLAEEIKRQRVALQQWIDMCKEYRFYTTVRHMLVLIDKFGGNHPPPEVAWHDLYLFRDGDVVLYVGRSSPQITGFKVENGAWNRVWGHLRGGFTGHSAIGELIRVSWPRSMDFGVEFVHSDSEFFAGRGNAEKYLIEHLRPCLNEAMNQEPAPLPSCYTYLGEHIGCPESIGAAIQESYCSTTSYPFSMVASPLTCSRCPVIFATLSKQYDAAGSISGQLEWPPEPLYTPVVRLGDHLLAEHMNSLDDSV